MVHLAGRKLPKTHISPILNYGSYCHRPFTHHEENLCKRVNPRAKIYRDQYTGILSPLRGKITPKNRNFGQSLNFRGCAHLLRLSNLSCALALVKFRLHGYILSTLPGENPSKYRSI